ncbi:hypothetical protein AYI68_g6792 [Smittium mucronatum]|uniref:Uncharacterized protein n=1 Tax=Smittium mucronatum TaxID=133383 RepID=A0A1R0GQL9_9FUNG|nr:hypothetical protein AYI68_g6792 [Smittium mucronatum]
MSVPSWLAGTVSGTSYTGQKFTLLVKNSQIPILGFRRKSAVDQLKIEFQKFSKKINYLILTGELFIEVQAASNSAFKL